MTVDYDTLDPLVRRDSYQDIASLETGMMQLNVLFFFHREFPLSKELLSLSLPVAGNLCSVSDFY